MEHTNLNKITRRSDLVFTHIHLNHPYEELLTFGACRIVNEGSNCFIGGYMSGSITDPEHDTCYAVRIELIGLKYMFSSDHTTWLEAWLTTDPDDIRFHPDTFDPFKVEDAQFCKSCSERDLSTHLILPEDYCTPPAPYFAEKIAGRKVEIVYGTKF